MTSEIRSRLLILAGLTVLGVGLAGVGTTLGVTDPISNTGPNPEFSVSEENVTFSNGGETETVISDMSYVREITLEETSPGHFTVSTEKEQPLTEAERARAKEIARTNETVQREINAMDEYNSTVEPIQKLNLSSSNWQGQFSKTVNVDGAGDEFSVEVENSTLENQDGSVIIDREPSYVEDRAVVRIRQPNEDELRELKHTVYVDLANNTVTRITDWDEIREDSPTINVTKEMNTTTTDQS